MYTVLYFRSRFFHFKILLAHTDYVYKPQRKATLFREGLQAWYKLLQVSTGLSLIS